MSTTYELSTIRDVFEKVPADRIALCLYEIAGVMIPLKTMMEAAGLDTSAVQFPESTQWVDDGKGVTGFMLNTTESGETVAKVQLTPEINIEVPQ